MSESQITAGMEALEHLSPYWDFSYSPAADLSDLLHVYKEQFKQPVQTNGYRGFISNQYEEHNIIIPGKAHHPNYTNTILLTRPHCSPVPVWSPLL